MEEIKNMRSHFSKLGWMYFLGTVIISAIQFLAGLVLGILKPEWLMDYNTNLILSMVLLYGIAMPIMILLIKRVPAAKPEQHKMKPGQFFVAIIMCFGLTYCCNFIGLCLTGIIGAIKGSAVDNVLVNVVSETSLWFNVVFMVICAPVMEEYVFRKLVVDRAVKYGQGAAVLLSGLLFGLFHGNLNQFAYAFSIGLFFAFIYVKTGKIGYTIAMHMIINFFGGVLATLMMKAMNYEGFMEAVNSGAAPEELMQLMLQSLPGWTAYGIYAIFVFGSIIAAIVLFIVFRKRFALEKGEEQISKGKKFVVMFINTGMGIFCIYWLTEIVLQIYGTSIEKWLSQLIYGIGK